MNIISVDVGQSVDPTAIVVWQERKFLSGKRYPPGTKPFFEEDSNIETQWLCRLIERVPLGTTYQTMIDRVKHIDKQVAGPNVLLVDMTGVGRPILEMMERSGLNPIGINITGGKIVHERSGEGWSVPKRDLVSSLMSIYQSGRLKVSSKLDLAPALTKEMLAFTAKITSTGHDTYEAHRSGDHDDLVLAMAMAAWYVLKFTRFIESSDVQREYERYDPTEQYRLQDR